MGILKKLAENLHIGRDGKKTEEATSSRKQVFDHTKVTVVYVLGGPGAGGWFGLFPNMESHSENLHTGKGTQCAKIVEDYGFVHLSGLSPHLASLSLLV
jgi:UMP-CMP kinase